MFLGLMAYLNPKGAGDSSMPVKRRSGPGVRDGASWDPRDMTKAGLPEPLISRRCKDSSIGKTSETGAMLCIGIKSLLVQPPGCGAIPSEGIQGDEWGVYVTLERTTRTNMGSPEGRESDGDGGPVVVAGVTTCLGGGSAVRRAKGAR
jgi:hypothetical protein